MPLLCHLTSLADACSAVGVLAEVRDGRLLVEGRDLTSYVHFDRSRDRRGRPITGVANRYIQIGSGKKARERQDGTYNFALLVPALSDLADRK